MSSPIGCLAEEDRALLERAEMPESVSPMLATLTDDRFSSDDWIFERKLDGVRCLAFHGRRGPRLVSRNGNDLDLAFPELAEAVHDNAAVHLIADGEIVAFDGAVTSFSRLQGRIGRRDPDEAAASGIRVWLYLFDILYCDGFDMSGLPLRQRKRVLRRALSWQDPLRWTPHRNGAGEACYEEACRKHWEGIIAKRADSAYTHGRSRDWLKFKCTAGQELVIGGFTEPQGSRKGFGALLLGYYENGRLRYAGRVGTGFDEALLETLHGRLTRLERKTPPFDPAPAPDVGVHWVTPRLVGEIGFTEWTNDGRLRHPRFLGLRTDKQPEDVVRERPAED
jgi:bifunctional non-homologous end joining protein LigD